jgi:hypothetical protein
MSMKNSNDTVGDRSCDLCSKGEGFNSVPRYRQCLLVVYLVSLSKLRIMRRLGHDVFLPHPSQLIIYCYPIVLPV